MDPVTRTAYVGNDTGWVSVFNLDAYSKLGGVRVRTPARIAVDPDTSTAFVANLGSNTLKVITP